MYVPLSTPTNDYYGGYRPGDNLFAESIVCLDARTGERVLALPGGAPRHLGTTTSPPPPMSSTCRSRAATSR